MACVAAAVAVVVVYRSQTDHQAWHGSVADPIVDVVVAADRSQATVAAAAAAVGDTAHPIAAAYVAEERTRQSSAFGSIVADEVQDQIPGAGPRAAVVAVRQIPTAGAALAVVLAERWRKAHQQVKIHLLFEVVSVHPLCSDCSSLV